MWERLGFADVPNETNSNKSRYNDRSCWESGKDLDVRNKINEKLENDDDRVDVVDDNVKIDRQSP